MTKEEFETLVEIGYEAVKNYVKRSGNADVAEDITQEVFYIAWKKRAHLKSHNNQMGWLIKTAKYKIREYERELAKRRTEEPGDLPLTIGSEEVAYQLTEWEVLLRGIMKEKEAELFLDHYYRGISVREIARREHIKEENLRMRLQRLKNRVKTQKTML